MSDPQLNRPSNLTTGVWVERDVVAIATSSTDATLIGNGAIQSDSAVQLRANGSTSSSSSAIGIDASGGVWTSSTTVAVNKGAASAAGAGLSILENGVETGYVKVGTDRSSFALRAPGRDTDWVIDQGTPLAVQTGTGLDVSNNLATLATASSSQAGSLSAADYARFDAIADEFAIQNNTLSTSSSLDISGNLDVSGSAQVSGTISTGGVASHLIPSTSNLTLGTPDQPWQHLYISANSLNIGATTLSLDAQSNLTINGNSIVTKDASGATVDLSPQIVIDVSNNRLAIGKTSASAPLDVSGDAVLAGSVAVGAISSTTGTLNVGTTDSAINLGCGTTVQTVNIGTNSGVTTINIGGSGDTVNIAGSLNYIQTTNLEVSDAQVVVNKGGASGSAGNAGLYVEENGTNTGYIKISASRDAWVVKDPSGTEALVPTTAGFSGAKALVSSGTRGLTESSVTSAELGYVSGVTSAIQTQLNAKQATVTGAASTITGSNLAVSRTLISDASGKVTASTVTSSELGHVSGVTSAIQTQLNGKQATVTGAASTITGVNLTASRAIISDASGKVAASAVTSTELGYLDGVTSAIQTQLDGKMSASNNIFGSGASGSTIIGSNAIEIGQERTNEGFAFIDLHGDTTYLDYSTRLIRGDTGANAISELVHRGTGHLSLRGQDGGDIVLQTSGSVGIGNSAPLDAKLDVTGVIKNTGAAGGTLLINEYNTSGTISYWKLATLSTAGNGHGMALDGNFSRIDQMMHVKYALQCATNTYRPYSEMSTVSGIGSARVLTYYDSSSNKVDVYLYVPSFTYVQFRMMYNNKSAIIYPTPTWTTSAPVTSDTYTLVHNTLTDSVITTMQAGSVGIGTTNPSNKVHAYENSSSGTLLLLEQASASGRAGIQLKNSGTAYNIQQVAGNTVFEQTVVGDVGFYNLGTLSVYDKNNTNAMRLRVSSSGKVGIGNTAPDNMLSINPTIAHRNLYDHSTAQLTIYDPNDNGGSTPNGTRDIMYLVREGVGAQSFGNKAAFAVGRYENSGSNSRTQLDIKLNDGSYTTDTTVLTLRSNGNVGIGVTAPTAKLDVGGSIVASGGLTASTVTASTVTASTVTASTLAGTLQTAAQPNITSVGTLTGLTVGTSITIPITGAVIRMGTSQQRTISINDGFGNFAISSNQFGSSKVVETDGISRLLFGGDAAAGSVSLNAGKVADTGYSIGLNVVSVDNTIKVGATNNMTGMMSNNGTTIADVSGNLYDAGTRLTTKFAALAGAAFTGNVGIGTATPQAAIHAYGVGQTAVNASTSSSLGGAMVLQDSGAAIGNGGMLVFGANQGQFAAIKGYIQSGVSNTLGDLNFLTRNAATDTTLTARMIIRSNGNVGIGSASPEYMLDVASNVRVFTNPASASHLNAGLQIRDGGTTVSEANAPRLSFNWDGKAAAQISMTSTGDLKIVNQTGVDLRSLSARDGTFSGTVSATALSGPLTGNASSATKLATARTINGVAFDGTADITITAPSYPSVIYLRTLSLTYPATYGASAWRRLSFNSPSFNRSIRSPATMSANGNLLVSTAGLYIFACQIQTDGAKSNGWADVAVGVHDTDTTGNFNELFTRINHPGGGLNGVYFQMTVPVSTVPRYLSLNFIEVNDGATGTSTQLKGANQSLEGNGTMFSLSYAGSI